MDEGIDEGIKKICKLFNLIDGVETFSSCEGHPNGAHIYFDSKTKPEWLWKVMKDLARDTEFCLGCCQIQWGFRAYYDCANTPIEYWYFEINPNETIDLKKEDIDIIWKSVKKTMKRILSKKKK